MSLDGVGVRLSAKNRQASSSRHGANRNEIHAIEAPQARTPTLFDPAIFRRAIPYIDGLFAW